MMQRRLIVSSKEMYNMNRAQPPAQKPLATQKEEKSNQATSAQRGPNFGGSKKKNRQPYARKVSCPFLMLCLFPSLRKHYKKSQRSMFGRGNANARKEK